LRVSNVWLNSVLNSFIFSAVNATFKSLPIFTPITAASLMNIFKESPKLFNCSGVIESTKSPNFIQV